MARNIFDLILISIRFSKQRKEIERSDPRGYRSGLVQDFINVFNEHRAVHVSLSEVVCVDASISSWYGWGGDWIENGLPHYVAIDRKPDNGFEIQNSARSKSGIMRHSEFVSTADYEAGREFEGDVLHGTALIKPFAKTCAGTGRVVGADSYYASIESCDEMERMGLKFIGVVKKATRRFPIEYLSEPELEKGVNERAL